MVCQRQKKGLELEIGSKWVCGPLAGQESQLLREIGRWHPMRSSPLHRTADFSASAELPWFQHTSPRWTSIDCDHVTHGKIDGCNGNVISCNLATIHVTNG